MHHYGKKKNKFIGIGKLPLALICLLIIPIIRQIRSVSMSLLDVKESRSYHPFIYSIIMFISMMLVGSLDLIVSSCQKEKTKINTLGPLIPLNPNKVIGLAHFQEKPKLLIKKFYLIIFAVVLDLLSTVLISILSFKNEKGLSLIRFQLSPIQLLFLCALCRFFFHFRLYAHHCFSVVLISIGVVLISYSELQDIVWYIIMIGSYSLPLSILILINHYLMNRMFVGLYRLLFLEGLIGFFISMLTTIIFSFVKCPKSILYCEGQYFETPFAFFETLTTNNMIFTFGIDLLSLSGINLCYFLINHSSFPTYVIIADVLASIVEWIIDLAGKTEKELQGIAILYITLQSIGYALVLISCLIFNEVIILYSCKLGKNTHVEIVKRSLENSSDYPD